MSLVGLAAALLVGGCAVGGAASSSGGPVKTEGNLVGVLASTTTPEDSRKAADAKLVAQKGKTDETRMAVLEQIVFAPGHSEAMRIYAMDQLAEADAARTGKALSLYLPRMEGAVLTHGCELAVKLGDVRVVDALVMSMWRAVDGTKEQGPEVEAIEKLSGKGVDEVLWGLLGQMRNESLRTAALDLLVMRVGEEEVKRRIGGAEKAEQWWVDMQDQIGDFGSLPHGANEMMWVRELRRSVNSELLARAKKRHEMLKGEKDYVFAVRFAGVLAYSSDAAAKMTRAELLADVKKRMEHERDARAAGGREHVSREAQYAGSREDVDESLEANEKKLTRCDLLAMRMILMSLEDGAVVEELQREGIEDLSDTASEHGGLLAVKDGKVVPRLYPPLFSESDFQYVTGDKLLRATMTGVAQYHFHFQQVHNGQRAGPGEGDLGYVKRARCNGVVVTSVGTRKMDVDYYTPGGAVVDLGVWESK